MQRSAGAAPPDWEMTALPASRIADRRGSLCGCRRKCNLTTRFERALGDWKDIEHTVRVRCEDQKAAIIL